MVSRVGGASRSRRATRVHPQPVHPADPLAEREADKDSGAHTQRGPEQHLTPTQPVVLAHAHPLTKAFAISLS